MSTKRRRKPVAKLLPTKALREARKKDALALAELAYDIFTQQKGKG